MPKMSDLFTLTDKVAFVTGGGFGLGRAICVGFAEAGADIVALARTKSQIEETAQMVRAKGRRCLPIPCDVTIRAQVEAAVEKALAQFGKIDILVNNAGGVHVHTPMEEMTEEVWDQQVTLNLKASFLCSHTVGKVMLKQGRGKIINIGSVAGFVPSAGIAGYNAGKAGMHNLTRALATEWGNRGIWVNGIAAGGMRSNASAKLLADRAKKGFPAEVQTYQKGTPPYQVCLAEPEEYVPIAIFLASAASDHLTGDIISPGGVALRRP